MNFPSSCRCSSNTDRRRCLNWFFPELQSVGMICTAVLLIIDLEPQCHFHTELTTNSVLVSGVGKGDGRFTIQSFTIVYNTTGLPGLVWRRGGGHFKLETIFPQRIPIQEQQNGAITFFHKEEKPERTSPPITEYVGNNKTAKLDGDWRIRIHSGDGTLLKKVLLEPQPESIKSFITIDS